MRFLGLLRQSFDAWQKDKAGQLAASTAYFTVFSLSPLLILLISLLGLLFDRAAVQKGVMDQMRTLVGDQGADAVGGMLAASHDSGHSVLAAAVGFAALLLGASGLFAALQDAFNGIWKVETAPRQNGILILVLRRLFSFGLILSVGFLLLVSLAATAMAAYVSGQVSSSVPALSVALPFLNILVSFIVIFFLFLLLIKYLPDVKMPWRDAAAGAALTTVLFLIGKELLGAYLGRQTASSYGVAGSLIILLLWINYSAQILFFGVEFTRTYALARGADIRPRGYARFIDPPERPPSLASRIGVLVPFVWAEWRILRFGWPLLRLLQRRRRG
jgi:membrane protein